MKKTYLIMMATLLFAAIGFSGCSDDDDGISGDVKALLVGTWELTHETGVEIRDGETTDSWDESYDNSGYYLIFYEDGTLDFAGEEIVTWSISGSNILLTDPYDDEVEVLTIRTLNETTLVLYITDSEEDDYYDNTMTFARR